MISGQGCFEVGIQPRAIMSAWEGLVNRKNDTKSKKAEEPLMRKGMRGINTMRGLEYTVLTWRFTNIYIAEVQKG